MPDDFNTTCARLPIETQESIKRGMTKILDEYVLFLTTALGEKNAAEELEKVWQMQRLLMSEILKGNIVFTSKDQLGKTQ